MRMGRAGLAAGILAAMPLRWVTRRNLDGREASPPRRAFVVGASVSEPGLRTVEQCVASLLNEGEGCKGTSERLLILKDGRLVGHIDITR